MTRTPRLLAAALAAAALSAPALAAEVETEIVDADFSFEGPFGVFEQASLQRGFQIYNEVCSSCHGMRYVAFRSLGDEDGPGYPPEQVKAFAAQHQFPQEDNPEEMRPGAPYDYFPTPEYFGAGTPPDLSLMAKARAAFHGPEGLGINQLFKGIGGPEYIYSLMIGYEEAPECAVGNEPDGYYNAAFASGAYPPSCIDEEGHRMAPGSWIAMPPPLGEGAVEYADGTPATLEQQAHDISAFLMWAAEPKLMDRKEAGLRNLFYLGLLAVLLYYVNKKIWKPVKAHRDKA